MRISDWSSDVCSSDLVDLRIKKIDLPTDSTVIRDVYRRMSAQRQQVASRLRAEGEEQAQTIRSEADRERTVILAKAERDAQKLRGAGRSEEHTSELQSLLRNSYAVFFLKKTQQPANV